MCTHLIWKTNSLIDLYLLEFNDQQGHAQINPFTITELHCIKLTS